MECNKDEAIRAKEIAEKKFRSRDVIGAMKFALKAQNLYPELDGVQQMISTLDVHVAAENKVIGDYDWYKILGVDPVADDETLRRQYRKLALSLHPDKNKSVGGDEAFKLVSQAWSLLSDKMKRAEYDQKRNIKTSQKAPAPNGVGSSAPPRVNGFHDPNKSAASSKKTHKSNGRPGQNPHKQKSNTFWTVCRTCRTQYEYLRVYLNHNLLCPNCHKAFFAIEIAPPSSNVHRTSKHQNHSQYMAGGSSSAGNAFQQAYTKVKRDREEGHGGMRREEAIRRKPMPASSSKRKGSVNDMAVNSQKKLSSSTGVNTKVADAANSTALDPDLREIIMQKARKEIRNYLDEKKSSTVEEAACKDGQNCDKEAPCNGSGEPMDMDTSESNITVKKSFWDVSVDVPDPDFHDFDKHRTEKSFSENQIWAIYDDSNGMPRRYALIKNIISSNPFEVRVSWLTPRTSNRYGLLNWVCSGFLVTCGDFTVGRSETSNSLNAFSHKVWWTKNSSGEISIFPRKGEVWALYRNWSPSWNELTASEEIHKYELVEVLEDYEEKQGVTIVPLVKVAGFRSMFHHHLDFREVRQIPKEEMSRFSHYIPSHLHRGQIAPSFLKGCKELDPAATPEELMYVIPDSELDILDNGEGT